MTALKWIGRHVWALVVGLVAILGAGILWSYHKGATRKLEDEKAVEAALRKVAELDAVREALDERKDENRKQIVELAARRREIQTELLELEGDIAAMSDEEVEAAFRELY